MKIIEINTYNSGSTGKIMFSIADLAAEMGHTSYTAAPMTRIKTNRKNHIIIGNVISRKLHKYFSIYTGIEGCMSYFSTLNFLRKLDKIKPDIIHLHNLHGWYINLPLLFGYIKKHNIKTVWTLHDCWSFTGRCPHFVGENCYKWKTGCYDCTFPSNRNPDAKRDATKTMWKLKKEWFTDINDLTIVTPSKWLADLVKESYLKDYPVKVINNGIDTTLFSPTSDSFREEYGISQEEKIVLGVSSYWDKSKGIDVFIDLAEKLDDSYRIVMIGTNNSVDKLLPKRILSIHRTENQNKLAQAYSAADVLLNPTREDTFPTVNIEALACGTPVITFKTGGSVEIPDENTGIVVPVDDIDGVKKAVETVCQYKMFTREACRRRAEECFRDKDKYLDYINLYIGG